MEWKQPTPTWDKKGEGHFPVEFQSEAAANSGWPKDDVDSPVVDYKFITSTQCFVQLQLIYTHLQTDWPHHHCIYGP